ncbi:MULTISPECIES: hypothetical protein [unclassified Streptomyces]|uniref:hypothetical protein n=1 Tax=unclassified Streptomyces TaxID=2593676 RepID=UPI00037C2894|nr:hypothetical protein [Streptomyces sp. 303MFCol5.2]
MQEDVPAVIDRDGVQKEIGLGLAQFLLGHRGRAELEHDRFPRSPTQRRAALDGTAEPGKQTPR